MSVFVQSMQVPGLVVFNVVMGLFVVRGIVHLVAKLTEEKPSIVLVGLPATVLVVTVSMAVWILATA
jgi:hypothetical protein